MLSSVAYFTCIFLTIISLVYLGVRAGFNLPLRFEPRPVVFWLLS